MNLMKPTGFAERPSVPLRLVLLSAAGLWLCYFIILSLRAYTLDADYQFELLWRRAIVSTVGFGFTLALWLVLRLFELRPAWTRYVVALMVCMPFAVAVTLANAEIFKALDKRIEQERGKEAMLRIRRDAAGNLLIEMPEELDEESRDRIGRVGQDPQNAIVVKDSSKEDSDWVWVSEMAFGRYFMFLAWCALYFSMLSGEKARVAERREGQFRRAAKAAELRSLRYQVNPHFLFNTLNSLSALVMVGRADEAEEMIQTLSTFYRRTLSSEPTADTTLEDEIELQKLYLAIEAVRFPKRLRTHIDLPPELAGAKVPGMILQPLVENSVKYAVAASPEPVTITIAARREADNLVVTVSDNGPGTETGDPHGIGIGLANVRERLEARFGPGERLKFGGNQRTEGFATSLVMPLGQDDG